MRIETYRANYQPIYPHPARVYSVGDVPPMTPMAPHSGDGGFVKAVLVGVAISIATQLILDWIRGK